MLNIGHILPFLAKDPEDDTSGSYQQNQPNTQKYINKTI
jgi:hypothetical protein